jgi:serine/threonine protein kinase
MYGQEVDWWSVGCVMCEMMLGTYYNLHFLRYPDRYVNYLTRDAVSILNMVGINYGIEIPYSLFNAMFFHTYRHRLYCRYVDIEKVCACGSREEFFCFGRSCFVLNLCLCDTWIHTSACLKLVVSVKFQGTSKGLPHPSNLLCICVSLNIVLYGLSCLLL